MLVIDDILLIKVINQPVESLPANSYFTSLAALETDEVKSQIKGQDSNPKVHKKLNTDSLLSTPYPHLWNIYDFATLQIAVYSLHFD